MWKDLEVILGVTALNRISLDLQEETEGSKEVQGLHFPHLALAFPVACYRLVTNFQETNRQQETHARSVNLRLSRNLSQPWVSLGHEGKVKADGGDNRKIRL